MAKLIESNPYALSQFSNIWADGFEAGQRSTLTPVPYCAGVAEFLENNVVNEIERLIAELAAVKAKLATVKAPPLDTAVYPAPVDLGWDKLERSCLKPPKTAAERMREMRAVNLSVTGRWWQAKNKDVFFIYKNQYVIYERITENNHDNSRWLSDEETREFD